MANQRPEQIREIYLKLPKDVQDAIFSVESAQLIESIGKKYNLTPDKISSLADQTGQVMFGLSPARDFIINIARNVYIDKETARKIAADINAQIFSKIRDSLKKIHGDLGEAPTPDGVGVPTPKDVGKEFKLSPPPPSQISKTLPSFTSIPIETVPPKPAAPQSVPLKSEPLPALKPTPSPSIPPPPSVPSKPSIPPPPIPSSSPIKISEAIDKEKILKDIEKEPEPKKYTGGSDPYREPI